MFEHKIVMVESRKGMDKFSTRQLSILNLLLNSEEPLSAKRLGSCLNLSARIVRHNLPPLRNWLITQDVPLINKPSMGIYIQATSDQRRNLLNHLNNKSIHNLHIKPENRILWMEFVLLEKGKPLKASGLQYELEISHNTLFKDLLALEQKIEIYYLSLKKTRGLGIYISGPEMKYRQRLLSLIRELVNESILIDLFIWRKISLEDPWSEKGMLMAKILKTINTWPIHDVWRSFGQYTKSLNMVFDDTELVRLVLYTSLAYLRILEGHTIDLPKTKLQEIKESREFQELRRLMSSCSFYQSVRFSDAEIGQIALEVCTAKKFKAQSDAQFSDIGETCLIAKKILDLVGKELGLNIITPNVVEMLSQHLKLSLMRLRNGLPIVNPILDDVERNFPATIEMVNHALGNLTELKSYCFPRSEIAYIALFVEMAKQEIGEISPRRNKNVIVVCPSGGITVGMLVMRLKNELPDINVVDVLSIREFNGRDIDPIIDAVITTSPTITHKRTKVICVSPLLSKDDIRSITHQINSGQSNA